MSDQSPMVGSWYTSLHDYKSSNAGELSFQKNELFQLIRSDGDWWIMKSDNNSIGSAPATFFSRYRGPKVNAQNGETSGETYAIAIFPYTAKLDDELTLNVRDKIRILDRADDGWWYGSLANKNGWFPNNFVKQIVPDAASPCNEKYFIHGVKAKYNFDSGNPDELSFVPGEVMDIIDKPQLDPEWWEAMKANGSVGLIPYNYVQTLENSSPVCAPLPPGKPESPPTGDQDIVTLPFYHRIQRVQAETMLRSRAAHGDFVVREATREGCYSLSVMAPDRIKHFQIEKNEKGEYSIGPRVFATFQELYEHYRVNPILTAANGEKYCLKQGLPN
ncbi:Cytoplasmic protein NCK1-like [Oopsacas minuta]|uniref:Cytoplasmic protein NCK1-like n=1 Tax=Oopsacas minuta TaxID=111878 RepID=A0AAV7JUL1_9METZ|nr:Cytoplasmic protein NCK1-like [Oopsacas minuta]